MKGYYNRAQTWTRKADYDRAIGDYDKVIEINPSHAEAYCNRGSAYMNRDFPYGGPPRASPPPEWYPEPRSVQVLFPGNRLGAHGRPGHASQQAQSAASDLLRSYEDRPSSPSVTFMRHRGARGA